MDDPKTQPAEKVPAEMASMRGLLHGIYRRLGEIRDLLREGRAVARAPEQPPLPGMPAADWAPPAISVPPRKWCNSVRAYEALWDARRGEPFSLPFLFGADMLRAVREATGGKIGPASYTRLLSALVRSGAARKLGRTEYELVEPTDAIREAVANASARKTAALERKEA